MVDRRKRTARFGAALFALLLLAGCGRKPNVVLITFDTTRADAVGYAANRPNLTPTLDQLANDGVWFSNAISSAPLTVPSHSTIMTGLMPYHHGARNNGTYILDKKNVTLAEMLKDAGYQTHAIVSSFVLDSQFGLDQGFDSYDDDLSAGQQQKMFMFREIKANQTANKAITWLKGRETGKPFFLWVHFFDPHADYEPPKEFAERFPGEKYEAEVAFADRELGRVLKTLDELDLRKNTLIVMTADHGEGLGDHGERTHGIYAYDSTIRVPLIFSGKGVAKRGRIDPLVRTADIVPTITEILGLPTKNVDGLSMTGLMRGAQERARVAYSESFSPRLNFGWAELRTMRSLESKFIDAPRPELYDLKKDPDESHNLYTSDTAIASSARPLVADLRAIERDDPFNHGGQREASVDPETKRKLSALGYVWGADTSTKSGPRPDPKDRIVYWERFEDAQAAIRNHQYGPALMMVRSVLEVDKDNVIALASMANVLLRINQRADALAVYKRIIELDPDRETGYLGASALLRESGHFADAESYGRTVIRMQPRNPDGYTAVGDVLLEQQRFPEAETMFREALTIDPHSAVAISGLGNCLNRAGKLRDALKVLRDGHEHDPHSELIAYNLGVVVERLGDPDGAKKIYEDTLKIDPEHSMAWNNLGAIYDRSGNQDEAIKCVTRARLADPLNVEAAYNLGVLLERANKPEDALANFNDTLRLKPDFMPAAAQRARVLTQMGRVDDALAAWQQLATVQPAAYLQIAKLEITRGHEKEARAAVREGLAKAGPRFRDAVMKDEQLKQLLPKTDARS